MHSTPSTRLSIAALLGVLTLGAGCTAAEEPAEPAEPSELATRGEQIFTSEVEDGNTFTCSTCHAISEPVEDRIRRVGHPLFDAVRRPTYKNGQLTELRDAVNSCLQEWMNAEPWTAADERWLALEEYLESVAPDEEAEPLRFEVVDPPPVSALGGGDAEAGRSLFNQSCSACHGEDGIGSQLAIPVGGRGLDPEYVAQRVRTSGRTQSEVYNGLTGGVMPFWAADRLSDDELRDLIAWLEIEQAPVDPPNDPPND
ncbi:MAG: c-type cytochrome, partial [Myxococcota bacterium]